MGRGGVHATDGRSKTCLGAPGKSIQPSLGLHNSSIERRYGMEMRAARRLPVVQVPLLT